MRYSGLFTLDDDEDVFEYYFPAAFNDPYRYRAK